MRRILLALAILVAVTSAEPGLSASVDVSVLEQAKDMYFEYIIDAINNLGLDNYKFNNDNGYLRNNKLKIMQRSNDVDFHLDPKNNAMWVHISNLDAQFYSKNFKYELIFIPVKGHAKINLKRCNLNVMIKFTERKVNKRLI